MWTEGLLTSSSSTLMRRSRRLVTVRSARSLSPPFNRCLHLFSAFLDLTVDVRDAVGDRLHISDEFKKDGVCCLSASLSIGLAAHLFSRRQPSTSDKLGILRISGRRRRRVHPRWSGMREEGGYSRGRGIWSRMGRRAGCVLFCLLVSPELTRCADLRLDGGQESDREPAHRAHSPYVVSERLLTPLSADYSRSRLSQLGAHRSCS